MLYTCLHIGISNAEDVREGCPGGPFVVITYRVSASPEVPASGADAHYGVVAGGRTEAGVAVDSASGGFPLRVPQVLPTLPAPLCQS